MNSAGAIKSHRAMTRSVNRYVEWEMVSQSKVAHTHNVGDEGEVGARNVTKKAS